MTDNIFEQNLDKNPANHQPLSPLSFFQRTASIYPNHIAIIHQSARITYKTYYERCVKLASQLKARGIGKGDTVSVMLSNTPSMLEAHMAVPMTGAILHTMNTRLDPETIAFQMDHAETRVLITDLEFSSTIKSALALCKVAPLVIDYIDPEHDIEGERLSDIDYESFLIAGDPDYQWSLPEDEWDAISVNYTSGTTGNPKGVVYHHRGAAIMCYANTIATGMTAHPVYLWTLPMFHCNGWCFPWSLAIVAGTHVCLRWVRAAAMYDAIVEHSVTHLSGAPIVMATMLNAPDEEKREITHRVAFNHAAAPPPQAVLDRMIAAGFELTHLYGLTETYGPAVINQWNKEWDLLSPDEIARKRVRQGVRYTALEGLAVIDPVTMQKTPADGETMGEIMFRGNIVMKGYLKNKEATEQAFAGGWFHSGDLGVMHEDGYIQLKDRSKDVIISGGENISSIEVEDVLHKHSHVSSAAVIGIPHEKWGETPCAIIELKPGAELSEDELIAFCRENMARYKCPTRIIFGELPKTSTGKIQKFRLREMVQNS